MRDLRPIRITEHDVACAKRDYNEMRHNHRMFTSYPLLVLEALWQEVLEYRNGSMQTIRKSINEELAKTIGDHINEDLTEDLGKPPRPPNPPKPPGGREWG